MFKILCPRMKPQNAARLAMQLMGHRQARPAISITEEGEYDEMRKGILPHNDINDKTCRPRQSLEMRLEDLLKEWNVECNEMETVLKKIHTYICY